ncbi:prealbumin-like fold domain-containing protein [Weissella cibaria]|nr:prealbumin-like fold domain-containing protein [Weissella cibaria]WCE24812.1 prealbumin-like fold domain-containing protein [Weissella cibaria]WCE27000.1 prealbumin-like fold domain-containing protein [Weissella cibaria]
MAKWKNAALITTLVLPLAITAGGEGVAVASQARPNQTTIKIHKQIRYDDTISGLSNDEKYFAWNHGSDEDGQHYFWGDGTEANKDTVTSDGNVVSSNNPFDWTNYRWVGHDEYTVNYTPTDDFAGQNKVTWKDLWSDLPGVHFIGIQLPDNVMTIDDDGEPQIIAKDAKGGVAFTTSDGKDIYWQDILKAQLGVQHSDAANPSHETPKHNFNSKTGTDKYGMKHEVNHSASDFEVEFQQLGAAKDLTEAQIRQALVANYADTDETDPVFGGKAGAVTDENGVLSFNNITNGNWLFMEDLQDSTPGLAEMVTQHAAPIFLATPYLQPNAEVDSKGNGTNKGDLTIEKLDDDTGKALTGVQFAMLELTDDQLADLQEQIDAGLLSKSVTDIKAYLKTLGTEDETLFYGTTGKDGKAKFSNLTPGKTYYALEISTPTGYMVNPTLQKVSLNSVNDTQVDPTVGGDDMTVQAQGGTYTVRNDDSIALDKDINVQNPVTVDNLAVDGYDADGNPNYIDKATNNPYYDDDTLWGVSRGKAFSYTVDAELNKNIGSYNKFNLVDSVPYQVNANSWTMYVQIDGVVTPLLQAVDTQGNANEHSTDDGISNESVAYDSDDHEGVSYKFAEGAEDFAKSLGYTGAFGKDADALAAQTAFVADNLLHMYGQSGNYQFDSEYRSVQSGENGTMNLDFKTDLLKGLGELIKDDTTGHTSVVFKINAQTN